MRAQGFYRSNLWEWRHDCPNCEHANDLHVVCRDCNSQPHALCSGHVHSERDPLIYAPCHCTWIPGTPRPKPSTLVEISMSTDSFESEIQNLTDMAPESASRILALFSEFIQFLDAEESKTQAEEILSEPEPPDTP